MSVVGINYFSCIRLLYKTLAGTTGSKTHTKSTCAQIQAHTHARTNTKSEVFLNPQ